MDNNYKHLYIIGNGFDIFTGLKTRYSDFRKWLESNYIFIYEAITSIYGNDGEWWNDFENELGNLNIANYVSRFRPKEKPLSELLEEWIDNEELLEKGDGLPHFYMDSPFAKRLEGLLDILQYCFEKWVQYEQNGYLPCKYTYIEKENTFFINFNYTDTLEILYHIPEEHVLHIHGRASKREHLVFGHNRSSLSYNTNNNDERKIADVISNFEKNPYQYINHYKLHERINNIEHVHVLGFSFSDIDFPYLEWIAIHTSRNCDWEVSWHSKEDKRRIYNFFREKPSLWPQLHLFQIKEFDD